MKCWPLILSAVFLASCGPEKSRDSMVDDEVRDRAEKDISPLRPIFGLYKGTWKATSGTIYECHFELREIKVRKKVGEQEVDVPVLRGSFTAIMENIDPEKPVQYMILGDVVSGSLNGGMLTLTLGGPLYEFYGKYQDGKIEGDLTVRGRGTLVKLERVNP